MRGLSERNGRKLADRFSEPPALPLADAAPGVPPPDCIAQIDDATAAYVAKMRAPFEGLRQAEAQLAGLLVLAAATNQAIAAHPMLDVAADAVAEAADGIRSITIPPRAEHHHAHVLQALEALRLTIAAARRRLVRRDAATIDAVLAPLRQAHQHLLWATGALPGFEVVALSQACCAQHAALPDRRETQ